MALYYLYSLFPPYLYRVAIGIHGLSPQFQDPVSGPYIGNGEARMIGGNKTRFNDTSKFL